MPRALRPGTAAPLVRASARDEAREQIEQARHGARLVLRVGQIAPNPNNPRRTFDVASINQLAASILEHGQLQPVVVRRVNDSWQLICGERRWRAHRAAGLDSIEAIEKDASDGDALRLALVENLHREDLSHQEKIAALDQLAEWVEGTGLNRTARELRIDPSWLSRRLSLRRDPVVFPALEAGRLSFRQASELLHAPAPARRTLLDRALRERASGEEIRKWAYDAKDDVKQGQENAVARLATASDRFAMIDTGQRLGRIVTELKSLEGDLTPDDAPRLEELIGIAGDMLGRLRQSSLGPRAKRRSLQLTKAGSTTV